MVEDARLKRILYDCNNCFHQYVCKYKNIFEKEIDRLKNLEIPEHIIDQLISPCSHFVYFGIDLLSDFKKGE